MLLRPGGIHVLPKPVKVDSVGHHQRHVLSLSRRRIRLAGRRKPIIRSTRSYVAAGKGRKDCPAAPAGLGKGICDDVACIVIAIVLRLNIAIVVPFVGIE